MAKQSQQQHSSRWQPIQTETGTLLAAPDENQTEEGFGCVVRSAYAEYTDIRFVPVSFTAVASALALFTTIVVTPHSFRF